MLYQVLIVACGSFPCSMWPLVPQAMTEPRPPALGARTTETPGKSPGSDCDCQVMRCLASGLIVKTSLSVHTCLVTPPCPTLCNPVDCSPPGSSVHGILQARTLEWVAFPPPLSTLLLIKMDHTRERIGNQTGYWGPEMLWKQE